MEVKDIISSGLLELYITGITTEEETLEVEQWINQYPEIKSEVEDLQEMIQSYALADAIEPDASLKDKILTKIKPDDSVKDKIFSRIQSQQTQQPFSVFRNEKIEEAKVFSLPAYYKWAIAASIILLLGSLLLNYSFYNKYQNASNDLQVAQQQLSREQQLAAAMNKDMDVMTDKNARPVVLNGTEHSPESVAKIFWMKNTGDVYVDPTNLPETPAGKQYQLWAIVDGKPVDAGMISTEKGIYHIQKMKTFGKAEAFAITLEKAGGSITPSMDQMIVQAKI